MHSTALLVVLAVGPILFDMQNALSWWRGLVIEPTEDRDEDYTILVPVFGSPRYFGPIQQWAFRRHKAHVLVVLERTPDGMSRFALDLIADGWNVWTCQLADACSPRLMYEALQSGVIATTYTIRMDADSRTDEDIARYIAAIRRDGADLVSTKVQANEPTTLAERFQAQEYRQAMLARHYRPMLTSGACYIAKTAELRALLARHTYWWCGEDVEVGMIAKAARLRVRHVDMEVLTDVPPTWAALWRQRRLWWAANFRHAIVNIDKNAIHRPMWTLYYVALVWVGLVLKADGMVTFPSWPVALASIAATWLIYVVVTVLGNLQVRSRWMIVFPLYAFTQAMLMPVVGASWYLVMVHRIGNWGRYRFGYLRSPLVGLSGEA